MRKLSGILTLLALCGLSAFAGDQQKFAVNDPTGAIYSVTNRFNDRIDYIHITKMDSNGYSIWETDYSSGLGQKPAGVVAAPNQLLILATQEMDGYRTFLLLAYDYRNYLLWNKIYDDRQSNLPVAFDVDPHGNIYVCGNTKDDIRYKARLWKFDKYGNYQWVVDYNTSWNAYAQQVKVLFDGTISLGVTIFSGSATSGRYDNAVAIYNSNGARVNY